eukprot:TRINITY_DN9420_c0_g2_i1.p1 TRINITY_DN9420_c0_g2~~TRINITY_DN9420_c0_g2_i1.p1  ORF type:complete len:321 (+),score=50.60 TRINITY_DN9420_c0_g2_i1:313-1275(+)
MFAAFFLFSLIALGTGQTTMEEEGNDLVNQLMGMLISSLNQSMGGTLTEDMITVNVTEGDADMTMTSDLDDISEEVDLASGTSTLTIGDTEYDVLQCLAPVDCTVIEYAGEVNSTYFYQLSNATEYVTTDFMACPGKLCLVQRFSELTQLLFEKTLAVSLDDTVQPILILPTPTMTPVFNMTMTEPQSMRQSCTCDLTPEPLCCNDVDYTNECLAKCAVEDVDAECTEGTCSGEPVEVMDIGTMMQSMMEAAMQSLMGGKRRLAGVEECEDKLDPCCEEYEVTAGEDICSIAEKMGSDCDAVKLYNGIDEAEVGSMIQIC